MKKLVIGCLNIIFLYGCTVVPPETVKLSSTIGSQMVVIRQSHIAEINTYFKAIEFQTSRAVDEVYAPDVVRKTLNGPSGKLLLEKLEAGKVGGQAAEDALEYTTRYLTVVRSLIEKERAARLKPIADAKSKILSNAEDAWAQVIQGNAVITGYLASAVKVRETQDDIFKQLGAPVNTQTLGADLASISEKIQKAVDDLHSKDAKIDDVKKAIDDALAELKAKIPQ